MVQRAPKGRSSIKEKRILIWKVGLVAALILFSFWVLIPSMRYYSLSPEERAEKDPGVLDKIRSKALNLGLDLQGGIHLVMQVDTSDMDDDEANDAVDKAMTVISNRVDQFGLLEPVVQRQGDDRIIIELPGMRDVERAKRLIGTTARLEFKLVCEDEDIRLVTDQINFYLSGAKDSTAVADTSEVDLFAEEGITEDESKKLTNLFQYQTTGGRPSFKILVNTEDISRVNAYLKDSEIQKIIGNRRVMFLWASEREIKNNMRELFLVKVLNEMTGDRIKDARMVLGSGMDAGKPEIQMENTPEGVREWANITGNNVGRSLAIVLDNTVYSAPNIREKIYSGSSRISGSFTNEEARDLAIVLRAGALPASVEIIEDRTIGPSLGADSIRKSRTALLIGLATVIVFMVIYYMGAGIIAMVALFLNMLFVLAYLAYFRATLTLPGMAGLILTIGMAVDANVLIFERIREELRRGNTTRVAVSNGYLRARWTILDSNITTFLTAIILYNFGTGPIKGFALTLMIGIVSSVFTALFVTRIIFDILTHKINLSKISIGMLAPFVNTKFNFIALRRKAFILSGVVILTGFVFLGIHGGPKYSIDFLGGSLMELHFDKPVAITNVREALGDVDVEGTDFATSEIKYIGKDKKDILIRIVKVENMQETSTKIKETLRNYFKDYLPEDDSEWLLREEQVGPSIGAELKSQAFWAIMFSLVVLIIYITIRFEFKYSIGAILALVHDVLITVGILTILSKEISLTIIAALLTIVGYSLNDTIVVFDRIREKLRKGNQEDYLSTLNKSVNETLGRTIITSLTTLFTVLSLFLFGGTVIHDFSFALLIGISVGTYSSIFVATPLLVEWYLAVNKKRSK